MTEDPALKRTERVIDIDELNLLFDYYKQLKNDLLLQSGAVKNHVRNSQFIAASLIAILSVLAKTQLFAIDGNTAWIWLVISGTSSRSHTI